MICFLLRWWDLKSDTKLRRSRLSGPTNPVQSSPAGDGNAEWGGASPVLSDVLLGLLRDGGSRGQAFGRLFGLPWRVLHRVPEQPLVRLSCEHWQRHTRLKYKHHGNTSEQQQKKKALWCQMFFFFFLISQSDNDCRFRMTEGLVSSQLIFMINSMCCLTELLWLKLSLQLTKCYFLQKQKPYKYSNVSTLSSWVGSYQRKLATHTPKCPRRDEGVLKTGHMR